jgi:heat shock protein HslJ
MRRVLAPLVALTLLIASVGVVGCSKPTPGSDGTPPTFDAAQRGGDLVGHWTVEQVRVTKEKMDPPPSGVVGDLTLTTDLKVSGSTGINAIAGTYGYTPRGSLQFSAFAMTKKAGPPAATSFEKVYLTSLEKTAAYYANKDQLYLLDAYGQVAMILKRSAVGTISGKFEVTGYNNGNQAVVSPIQGYPITAEFKDGVIAGSAGVNTYRATYSTEGTGIVVEEATLLTKKAGAPDAMAQETQYLAALKTAAMWQLLGNQMQFRTKKDALAVTFVVTK